MLKAAKSAQAKKERVVREAHETAQRALRTKEDEIQRLLKREKDLVSMAATANKQCANMKLSHKRKPFIHIVLNFNTLSSIWHPWFMNNVNLRSAGFTIGTMRLARYLGGSDLSGDNFNLEDLLWDAPCWIEEHCKLVAVEAGTHRAATIQSWAPTEEEDYNELIQRHQMSGSMN